MPGPPPDPVLRRAFLVSYGVGFVLCVLWPLVLQALLGTLLRPGFLAVSGLAEELGYTFTGLVVLGILYVKGRSRKALRTFQALEAEQRPRVLAREVLVYAAIFELSACLGLVYDGLGGPHAERYARSFVALASVMFLVFVPRFAAWERAARGPA